MFDKIDLYELLNTLVPGVLLLSSAPVFFPVLVTVTTPQYPEAFQVVALTVAAFILGQLVTALASLIEPVLFWTFGGRPSERALRQGLGTYLPPDTAARIRTKLRSQLGDGTSDRSLYLFAIQQTHTGTDRAAKFNSLYAHHRGLVVLVLLLLVSFVISTYWGAAAGWPSSLKQALLVMLLVTLFLTWYRTKQRAFYYVREVLFTTERVIDERKQQLPMAAQASSKA